MKISEKEFVKASRDDVFKAVIGYPKYGKKILEKILSQTLKKEVKLIKFFNNEISKGIANERKKLLDALIEVEGGYVNVEINLNDYSKAKRIRNFNYITSFYSQNVRKGDMYDINSEYIQVNLNYGKTDHSYTYKSFYMQSDDHEKYVDNFKIVEINIENLKVACYNGEEREEEYKYIIMVDKDKEELSKYYPNDKIIKEFEYVLMKVNEEFNWLTPEEDEILLRNTEKEISYQDGVKNGIEQGIEQGVEKNTIDVIINAINQSISIETIATLVNLSVDEVKNIIKEQNLEIDLNK